MQEWPRRLLYRKHGTKTVADNLLKELQRETRLFWVPSYRQMPLNHSIDVIWVVNGKEDLRWALNHKSAMNARQLWAGPNIAVIPQEEERLLLSDRIDRIVVPCDWVAALYRAQATSLQSKLAVWPVGIDTDYWSPATAKTFQLLVYNKGQDALCSQITSALDAASISYRTVRYGSHTACEYRAELSQASGLVWLSASESEGLAVLEAFSMNVPVLAWNPGEWNYASAELRKSFSCRASSVPYFDARCGEIFQTIIQFPTALMTFQNRLTTYRPRDYLLANHLDLASNLKGWRILDHL
jgi:glycosyltransferase involved in cell wall biosynthesis